MSELKPMYGAVDAIEGNRVFILNTVFVSLMERIHGKNIYISYEDNGTKICFYKHNGLDDDGKDIFKLIAWHDVSFVKWRHG